MEFEFREATHDDYDAVVAFTEDTWPDREGGDYIPRVYHDWLDGEERKTFVADPAGETDLAGIVQAVAISEHEAWLQGMRVNPDYRGEGVGTLLTRAGFDWARQRGLTVGRAMVFSWNAQGLGLSRAAGFDPATEFRWVHPAPDAGADPALTTTAESDAAWALWQESGARDHLKGLALDARESWALSELTREGLRNAASDDRLFVVGDESGTRGFVYRNREYDRENPETGDDERWAEYGVAAWEPGDVEAVRSLTDAVARDAGEVGADRTRVLVPETVDFVSDVAVTRTEIGAEPDFVLSADLTAEFGD